MWTAPIKRSSERSRSRFERRVSAARQGPQHEFLGRRDDRHQHGGKLDLVSRVGENLDLSAKKLRYTASLSSEPTDRRVVRADRPPVKPAHSGLSNVFSARRRMPALLLRQARRCRLRRLPLPSTRKPRPC